MKSGRLSLNSYFNFKPASQWIRFSLNASVVFSPPNWTRGNKWKIFFFIYSCNVSQTIWTTLSLPVILKNPNFVPFYLTIRNNPLSEFVFNSSLVPLLSWLLLSFPPNTLLLPSFHRVICLIKERTGVSLPAANPRSFFPVRGAPSAAQLMKLCLRFIHKLACCIMKVRPLKLPAVVFSFCLSLLVMTSSDGNLLIMLLS